MYLRTPLFYAVKKGNQKMVERLIDYGAYIDIKDKHSQTPLHVASASGFYNIVEILGQKSENINSKDQHLLR